MGRFVCGRGASDAIAGVTPPPSARKRRWCRPDCQPPAPSSRAGNTSTGAATFCFIQAIERHGTKLTYGELLLAMHNTLQATSGCRARQGGGGRQGGSWWGCGVRSGVCVSSPTARECRAGEALQAGRLPLLASALAWPVPRLTPPCCDSPAPVFVLHPNACTVGQASQGSSGGGGLLGMLLGGGGMTGGGYRGQEPV